MRRGSTLCFSTRNCEVFSCGISFWNRLGWLIVVRDHWQDQSLNSSRCLGKHAQVRASGKEWNRPGDNDEINKTAHKKLHEKSPYLAILKHIVFPFLRVFHQFPKEKLISRPGTRFVNKFRVFKIDYVTVHIPISLVTFTTVFIGLILTISPCFRPRGYCGVRHHYGEHMHCSSPYSPLDHQCKLEWACM